MFGVAFLVACGLYIALALFVAKRVGKAWDSKLARYATIAMFVLLPTWDLIPGQLYHDHLCKTEGGIKVFKTIEIDRAYFLPNGQPDEKKIREQLLDRVVAEPDRTFSTLFHITKDQTFLVDKQTGERLGTTTDFWYYGGWFQASLLHLGSTTICPQDPNHDVYSDSLRDVVRPRVDTQLGGQEHGKSD